MKSTKMVEVAESSKLLQAVDWAYEKAVNGVAGLDSAEELAESYRDPKLTVREQANSLIRWQNSKAATSGFVTGLGGILTLPVTLPANIVSVMYVQIRMIAAIAHLGGYDIRDDKVKTLVFHCLVANSAKEILKDIGVAAGNKIGMALVKKIPGSVFIAINKRVGFRLVTKAGEKGIVNLVKVVPLLGGLVGGGVDLYSTNKIGKIARDTFTDKT